MDQRDITKTIGQMRTAADAGLRRRRIGYRVAVIVLASACVALGVLVLRASPTWDTVRTLAHNAEVDPDDRNRFTSGAASYVGTDDMDRARVEAWGRISSQGPGGPLDLLAVRFTYALPAPPSAEVVPVGRWAEAAPHDQNDNDTNEAVEWNDGSFHTADGGSQHVTTGSGRLAMATTGCTSSKRKGEPTRRMCSGSIVFTTDADVTDREAVPDDIVFARRSGSGSMTGLATVVLVDNARRWDACDLLTCSSLSAVD